MGDIDAVAEDATHTNRDNDNNGIEKQDDDTHNGNSDGRNKETEDMMIVEETDEAELDKELRNLRCQIATVRQGVGKRESYKEKEFKHVCFLYLCMYVYIYV